MTEDAEHLRLLSIFHYVVGGLTALFASFPIIHVAIGIAIVTGSFNDPKNGSAPPSAFGWFFIVIGALFIVLGWAYAIGMFVAGRNLRQRRGYLYCLVMAGLSCANFPFGTCLGVFTLIVLLRPSVKPLFEKGAGTVSDFA
ncbi:hypothetical protein P12x_005501 [Tundrisphaera lichenicola]|uniref:hypothetical protein n=1 Tax=Tundrisphaera lichenicola TaxID=2029860 RepID=UPI003EB9FD8D